MTSSREKENGGTYDKRFVKPCPDCGSGVRFDPLASLGCGPDDLALAVLSATNERVALDADESAAIVEALFARVVSDG